MAKQIKMTFTLDAATAARIAQTAERLGLPKSGVVREAVRDYAARVGKLAENERLRLLEAFDRLVDRIPSQPASTADRELADMRRARRAGGRRSAVRPR